MGDKNTILLKIAGHYEEQAKRDAALAQLFTSLAAVKPQAEKKVEHQSPAVRKEAEPEAFKCHCGILAKRIDGVAKPGTKNAGKPYIMWVCPKGRAEACGYREFEDVKELASRQFEDMPEEDFRY